MQGCAASPGAALRQPLSLLPSRPPYCPCICLLPRTPARPRSPLMRRSVALPRSPTHTRDDRHRYFSIVYLVPFLPPHHLFASNSSSLSASTSLNKNAFTKKRAVRSSTAVDGTSLGMTSKPCRSQRSAQSCFMATQPTMLVTSTTSRWTAFPSGGTAHSSR